MEQFSTIASFAPTCDGQLTDLVTAGCSGSGRSRPLTSESSCNRHSSNLWARCVMACAQHRRIRSDPEVSVDVLPSHSRQCAVVNKTIRGNLPRGKIVPPPMTDFLIAQEHVTSPGLSLRELTPQCSSLLVLGGCGVFPIQAYITFTYHIAVSNPL